jgi:cell division septation protein DedD
VRKNRSISSMLLAVSAVLATITLTNAYAADSYYIEIGKPSTIEEAHEQWEDLSKKYKSLLQKLTFYPKSVINEQGEESNIIQAGPITEKERAQKICNRFFARGIQCFVLEGIENAPPKVAIGMTRASNSASPSGEFIFPWQRSNSGNYVERAPEVYASANDADVDVAQAIPVPLSDKTEGEYRNISNTPEIKSQPIEPPVEVVGEKKAAPKSMIKNFSPTEFAPEETGTLVIERFADEGQAKKFWNYISSEFPDMVHGLRVRVQRPRVIDDKGGIQFKAYPFNSGEAAAAFCNQVVNAFGMELECHYEVSREQVTTQTGSSAHANGYLQRRNFQRRIPSEQYALQSRRHNSSIAVQELPEVGKSYWAQVAIAESQAEAADRWEDIKKKNKAIVDDVPSRLTSSSSSYAKYSVRLGSFNSEDEANELCSKLQAKGVDCLVVSTR